jgi:signal transduction histidine kinase
VKVPSVSETVFQELKRYVRFGEDDELALRTLHPLVAPHFSQIADHFYERVQEHPQAHRVLTAPEQVERLKGTLRDWLGLLFSGPWDDAYHERRARIGRVHVKIGLPQRYMFGAMSVIRTDLHEIVEREIADHPTRTQLTAALHKILDLELAIMLETFREAFVDVRTRRAERLAALGTMAAGLAHELRNPLNSAHLQLNVAERRLARSRAPDLQMDVQGARSAVELAQGEMKRLAGLVDDFLQFAKPQPLRLAFVDLRSTAEVIVSLVTPEAQAAGVSLALEPGIPVRLELDDEKIKQVLLNLVRNAIEASASGDRVHVSVEAIGSTAFLRVIDHGPGLPADAPIFEPFFTTKEHGTGLGLAIVHRIALDHGGTVGVESRPGHTVFSVSLPAIPEGPL